MTSTSPPPSALGDEVAFVLPAAGAGELAVLRAQGSEAVLARAYDAQRWEALVRVNSAPISVVCVDSDSAEAPAGHVCGVREPGDYTVERVALPAALGAASARAHAARLLQQGGFGGSRAELAQLVAQYGQPAAGEKGNGNGNGPLDVGAWVRDQQRLPATSTRRYFRQRSSDRLAPDADWARPVTRACDTDSRWHAFVFTARDVDRELRVRAVPGSGGERLALEIDGELRGEVAAAAFAANDTARAYAICDVREGERFDVHLRRPGAASCRGNDRLRVDNLPIQFADDGVNLPARAFQRFDDDLLTRLVPVNGGFPPGAFVLKAFGEPCALDPDAANVFIQVGDRILRHDPRLIYQVSYFE